MSVDLCFFVQTRAMTFRRETIRIALRMIPDCIQMVFTHTYISTTFLILYGTMWSLNMRFDTSFFAVAACLLGYLDMSVMDFGLCIRNFVNYFTAEKRIQVCLLISSFLMGSSIVEISSARRITTRSATSLPLRHTALRGCIARANHTPPRMSSPTSTLATGKRIFDFRRSYRHLTVLSHSTHHSRSQTSSSMLIQAISSASSDLSDQAKSVQHPLLLTHSDAGIIVHVELSSANTHRWDRLLRWQSATAWLVLLCPTRALWVTVCHCEMGVHRRSSLLWTGIFSSTVKKNILFGKEYDAQLFRRVIRAAALEAVSRVLVDRERETLFIGFCYVGLCPTAERSEHGGGWSRCDAVWSEWPTSMDRWRREDVSI